MNWKDYIHSDSEILNGKPIIKGTRISVSFIITLLASGWTDEEILIEYPHLQKEHIQSALLFVADCMQDEYFYSLPMGS